MSAPIALRRALGLTALAAGSLFAFPADAQDTDDAAAAEKADAPKEEGGGEPSESKDDAKASNNEGTDKADASVEAPASLSTDALALGTATHAGRFRRFWVGVAGSFELVFLGQGTDVCKLTPDAKPVGPLGAYCTNPDGSDFPSRATPAQNDSLLPGRAGEIDGGVKVGDVRVLVAADYAVNASILAGVRIGYVLNDYPGDTGVSGRIAFLRNVHLEARGTYLFGPDPLTRVAFAPMVFAGAGVAPMDGRALTQVSVAGVRGRTPINAWQIGGPGYLVAGGGVRYAFSPRVGFTMAWKASLGLGTGGAMFATGPEIGFQYGF